MIKEGKFESRQAIALLVITCLAKEFFTESNIIANKVGTAGWYMVLISAVVACRLCLCICLTQTFSR